MYQYKLGGWKKNKDILTFYTVDATKEEEFKLIEGAISVLLKCDKGQSLYRIFQKNFDEIIEYWQRKKQSFKRERTFGFKDGYEIVQEMDRKIINYLSSFKAFISYWEMKLNRLEFQEAYLYDIFKKRTIVHYDYNFSYRFL